MTSIMGRPQRFVLPAVSFLALVALSSATYSYLGIDKVVRSQDRLIERKYEGSLSENLGFLTVLATEISQNYDFESREETAKTESVEVYLRSVKGALESAAPSPVTAERVVDVLEYISDRKTLVNLLVDPELASFSVAQLGLAKQANDAAPGRPHLESFRDDRFSMKSFVFVPAPLVSMDAESGKVDVPLLMKKEIVFSKLAETYILNAKKELSDLIEVDQAYFIPYSGLTRIMSYKSADQLKHYEGKFYPLKSSSDRTYFSKTRDKIFRRTEPYVDTAGGGVVVTYTIYIFNETLNIIGIIGIDRNLGTLTELWPDLDSSSGLSAYLSALTLRDFHFDIHQLKDPGTRVEPSSSESFEDWVATELDKNSAEASQGIKRWSSVEQEEWFHEEKTIFTVPLGDGQIGCFTFDAHKIELKYRNLMVVYVGSLALIPIVILFFYFFRRSQIAERHGEEVEALYSEVVSNLHGGFLVVDSSGLILLHNDRILEMVGRRGSLKGAYLKSILTTDSYNEYSALASPDGFEFPGKVREASGDSRPVIIASSPIARGELAGSSMLIFLPSEELEVTIGSKFIHGFSHALKTPAHSILLIADTFRRKRGYRNFKHYYSLMENQIREFSKLIDNVLYFSELKLRTLGRTGKVENISQTLRSVAKVTAERTREQGLDFGSSIPDKLLIPVDLDMFRIVMNNLIDNALKYTKEGKIFLRAVDKLDYVKISVSDTGIGVRPKDREDIFNMFFRSDDKGVREQEGLGLGLYVSKSYVSMLGGDLSYEPVAEDSFRADVNDSKSCGSRFFLTLPKTQKGSRHEEVENPSRG